MLTISKAAAAADQFFSVIDAPRPTRGQFKEAEINVRDDIVFEGATFAYPTRPHTRILDGLDLTIEAGKTTAIVGPSGSGKSTIVGLIQQWFRLEEVQETGIAGVETGKDIEEGGSGAAKEKVKISGRVSISGHSLSQVDLKWWRSQIGLVQQEPFLFNQSIYRNVANGLIGTQWEDETEEKKRELVRDACIEAFATEFIDKLPQVSIPLFSLNNGMTLMTLIGV